MFARAASTEERGAIGINVDVLAFNDQGLSKDGLNA